MEPISLVLAVGGAVVTTTVVVARIVTVRLSGDKQKNQIKTQARHANQRMNQASRIYLNNVEKLLRR